MGFEIANSIAELQASNPDKSDVIHEGDDHIRLIKNVLKVIFAGEDAPDGTPANGFKTPIIVNPERINGALAGYDSAKGTVESRLNALGSDTNLYAQAGTKMLFYSPSAPTGWVRIEENTAHMVVIDSTKGGTKGGTANPLSIDFSHKHTVGDTTLDVSQIPSHTHAMFASVVDVQNGSDGSGERVGRVPTDGHTSATGGSKSHTHTLTNTSLTWSPKYFTCILASKDGNRVAP